MSKVYTIKNSKLLSSKVYRPTILEGISILNSTSTQGPYPLMSWCYAAYGKLGKTDTTLDWLFLPKAVKLGRYKVRQKLQHTDFHLTWSRVRQLCSGSTKLTHKLICIGKLGKYCIAVFCALFVMGEMPSISRTHEVCSKTLSIGSVCYYWTTYFIVKQMSQMIRDDALHSEDPGFLKN